MRIRLTLLVAPLLAALAAPAYADWLGLYDDTPAPQAAPAAYNAQAETRTPLVIIRFSQRNVYYEHALENAVTKAVEAKRNVAFDVVLRPGAGSSGKQHVSKVLGSLNGMGIPSSQIAAATGSPSGTRYDEIYVFVR